MLQKDFVMTRQKISILVLLVALFPAMPAAASDIYKYEDDEGVLHFTDAPTDHRFKIFMRDIKKDRQLRTSFRLTGCAGNPAEFDPIINSCALEYGVESRWSKRLFMPSPAMIPMPFRPREQAASCS